jgi:hypothetical protein
MTLPLTVATLAHAYDYLCEFPPFDKWNLPPSEDIKFSIIKKADRYAHYQMVNGVHHIAVSTKFVGRHESLLSTLSHEMIHLHCRAANQDERPARQRLPEVRRSRLQIHEFDRLTF